MATLVTVTGTITLAGEPAVGQIIFTMPGPVYDVDNNLVEAQATYRKVLTAGEFSIDLPAGNDPDLVPAEWTYDVDIALSGNQHIRGAILVDIANVLLGQEFMGTFEPGASPADAALYVRRSGDVMTGPLTLSGAPTAALHAATKAYVDASIGPGSGVTSVFGRTGVVVAATNDYSVVQINGLTSQLAAKAPIASPTFTGTVTLPGAPAASLQAATKAYVDAAQTAAQDYADTADGVLAGTVNTALALKANIASPTFTGTVSGITKTMVGLGNVDNTSDSNKPVSTATQTALDGKSATGHTHALTATRPVVRESRVVSGNESFPNTGSNYEVVTDLNAPAIPAAVGDWVEVSIAALFDLASNSFIDIAVTVGGSIVRYMGTGSSTPPTEGNPGYYPDPGFNGHPGPQGFVVTAPDLDGANVQFALVAKSPGAGSVLATTDFPFYWLVKNLGPVS